MPELTDPSPPEPSRILRNFVVLFWGVGVACGAQERMLDLLESGQLSHLTWALGSECSMSSGRAEELLGAEPCLHRPHPDSQDYRKPVRDVVMSVLILLSPSFRLE